MRRRRGLLVAAGLLALAASLTDTTAQAGGRWGEGYFPNHEVITQDGERVAFYDDLIKGKRVVVSFIYTSCKDLCPINTARLAQVAEMLGDEVGRDVFFISISVDPQTDTPERLRAFKDAFYDRPGWTFITGDPEELREIGSSLGNNSPIPAQHRNEIILGNEANGEWARNTPFGDPVSLVFAIRDMDPEWRAEVRAPDTRFLSVEDYQHLQLGSEPGQALFRKMCAPCHTVGVGDQAGPDLLGVTDRRPLHPRPRTAAPRGGRRRARSRGALSGRAHALLRADGKRCGRSHRVPQDEDGRGHAGARRSDRA
jgi:protein SCO1